MQGVKLDRQDEEQVSECIWMALTYYYLSMMLLGVLLQEWNP